MKNPLHSICPYFAMFPEAFAAEQILAHTQKGDWVFDPFCGRGTAVFESLLRGRRAAGTDTNPVAACIAGAKARPPHLGAVERRLCALRSVYRKPAAASLPGSEFYGACFHQRTLDQLVFLRQNLHWATSATDRFIAAVLLGCLHGESHKSANCLSNRMPRTISTKPDYSVRWWAKHGCQPPERDCFTILHRMCAYRLAGDVPALRGEVKLRNARQAGRSFPRLAGRVRLLLTSPPYLDTTDYLEDQWLRLWFLGGGEYPARNLRGDDRHRCTREYWSFLAESWAGCAPLLGSPATVVVRLGGAQLSRTTLLEGLVDSLRTGLRGRKVHPLHEGHTTTIRKSQANVFRPGLNVRHLEHDFVFTVV